MYKVPSTIDELVERQIKSWLEQKKQNASKSQATAVRPCITISREHGARGVALGKQIAERLGFSFWDQEIVHAISEKTGMDEKLLETLDEHTRTAIEVLVDGLLRGRSLSEGEYLRQLMRLFHTISKQGQAVIVGRGAQFILGVEEALHVRAVSPYGHKIRELVKYKKISDSAARAEMEEIESERRDFIQHHYGRDVTDPSVYDIIVNLGTLSMEDAVNIVVYAYEARFNQ